MTSGSSGRLFSDLAIVMVSCLPLGLFPTQPTSPPPIRSDAIAQVHALAKAMYPALVGQGLRTKVVSELYFDIDPLPLWNFRYSILSEPESLQPGPLAIQVEHVDDDGMIEFCFAWGDFVNSARHELLLETLWSHTDYSETQDTEALRAAGARFGPWSRAAFLAQTLPRLQALGPHWGRLTAWTAEFEGRNLDGGQGQPRMSWRMDVTLQSARGKRYYRLFFEPFDGQLRALARSFPRGR
jgi:hypothetical protein